MSIVLLIGILSAALLAYFAVSVARQKYESVEEAQLPKRRPYFVPYPKYTVEYVLSAPPNSMGQWLSLIDVRLSELGFRKIEESPLTYQRGLKYGDFSTKVAQINVELDDYANEHGQFRIYYGWVCLFDTGDLWKLAVEIKETLER